jgi:hypothetical protein
VVAATAVVATAAGAVVAAASVGAGVAAEAHALNAIVRTIAITKILKMLFLLIISSPISISNVLS